MKPAIQILNYNGLRWLPDLLATLKAGAIKGQKIYLVDNGSSDKSLSYIESEHPEVTIVRNGENLGYASAYNRSIPMAFSDGCDWVCLLNTDILVDENWLKQMAVAAEIDPRLGILGPVFTKWDSSQPNYYMEGRCPDVIPYMFDVTKEPVDRDWVEGSVFLIRKSCYEDIGDLDSLYFMYWEEADYCRRARFHGWRVAVVPGSICKHYAAGSATGENMKFLQLRNHFYYKLTDPNQKYSKNILSAARLGMTYFKQHLWDAPDAENIGCLLRSLTSTSLNLPSCYRSWKSNRIKTS